jgi:hypothetical protein
VADLFAGGDRTTVSGRNIFRSIEELGRRVTDRGFTVVEIGCGAPEPHPEWAEVSGMVDAWIERHCNGRPGYSEWEADRSHLEAHVAAGDVVGGSLVATLARHADRSDDQALLGGGMN